MCSAQHSFEDQKHPGVSTCYSDKYLLEKRIFWEDLIPSFSIRSSVHLFFHKHTQLSLRVEEGDSVWNTSVEKTKNVLFKSSNCSFLLNILCLQSGVFLGESSNVFMLSKMLF